MSNFYILLLDFSILFPFDQIKCRWAGTPLLSFTSRFPTTACAAGHRSLHTPACPVKVSSQQNGWQPLNQCFHISYLVNNFHQQSFASLTVSQKLHRGCLTPDLLQNSSTQPCLMGAAVRWRGCPVVQLQNLSLLLAMPEPEMSQLFFNISTELLSYLI